jgi:hypothetical protein
VAVDEGVAVVESVGDRADAEAESVVLEECEGVNVCVCEGVRAPVEEALEEEEGLEEELLVAEA